MVWQTALSSAIQVAIAIAGFSGIVVALGRRGASDWTQYNEMRFQVLLAGSAGTLIFAFLPFVLIDLVRPGLAWRVVSALFLIFLIGIMILRLRQVRRLRMSFAERPRLLHINPWLFGVVQVIVLAMLVGNMIWFASSSLYVVAVIWSLAISFLAFVTLLLESWREPPK